MSDSEKVIILGASDNPERYSYKALQMLRQHGHVVLGVHPKLSQVDGIEVFPSLAEAASGFGAIDTITLYLSPARSRALAEEIVAVRPKRVIMNPGTEDRELKTRLQEANIRVEEACTLVLLSTGQF